MAYKAFLNLYYASAVLGTILLGFGKFSLDSYRRSRNLLIGDCTSPDIFSNECCYGIHGNTEFVLNCVTHFPVLAVVEMVGGVFLIISGCALHHTFAAIRKYKGRGTIEDDDHTQEETADTRPLPNIQTRRSCDEQRDATPIQPWEILRLFLFSPLDLLDMSRAQRVSSEESVELLDLEETYGVGVEDGLARVAEETFSL